MKPHTSLRLGLAVVLTLASGIITDAQTNWPTAKTARIATPSKPVQIRKARAAKRRGATRAAAPSGATARVTASTATQMELLRSMADLVTRQATAIDALARRLEAAEARLELLAAAPQQAPVVAEIDEAQAPFRAALAIDWAEVIGR
jgi:hypothetical protein